MSSPTGWYPDPGGRPGAYRFWDGQRWSTVVGTDPNAPAPPSGEAARSRDILQLGPTRRSGSRLWLVGLLALILVVAVVVVLVVRSQSGGLELTDPRPTGQSTRELCPLPQRESSPAPPGDRVVSGQLSYPRLGAPFTPPTYDGRVPYGRNIRSQVAQVEARPDGSLLWVAQILIAQLNAGDGFYEVEQGANIVADCIAGLFYADVQVERTDRRNEALRVDGQRGWIVEAHLTFDVEDIKTKGETMIIVVVETDEGAGLFYGSLPDTSPEFNQMIRQSLADLRVG